MVLSRIICLNDKLLMPCRGSIYEIPLRMVGEDMTIKGNAVTEEMIDNDRATCVAMYATAIFLNILQTPDLHVILNAHVLSRRASGRVMLIDSVHW